MIKSKVVVIVLIIFCSIPLLAQEIKHTVFLIGDAGKASGGQRAVFDHVDQQVKQKNGSAMVILGDNAYPQGLTLDNAENYDLAVTGLERQLQSAKQFGGEVIFLPGNHDWGQGRKGGWGNVMRQEKYVENYLDSADVFLPSSGCPGPELVEVSDDLAIVIIDTQWFLHPWEKPNGEIGGCEATSEIEVLQQLDNLLFSNRNKQLLVVTHHPMYSAGSHGGKVPLKQHFLPPVLGSIYAGYRQFFGSVQDISNPKYKNMRNALVSVMGKYPNLVHAAGHEHSLQYFQKNNNHYIVSGAGAKSTYVRDTKETTFTAEEYGYAQLDYYDNGDVKLSFYGVPEGGTEVNKAYEQVLYTKKVETAPTRKEMADISFEGQMVQVNASDQYVKKKGYRTWFGDNYRDVWKQELEVPVFDIGAEHGGLKIVQRGGGMQTKSLRLQAESGKQYVLRSIEKFAEGAVPEMFRKTFAVDIVQDQISASHPYGAFVVPYLAEAIGIYHTNPKLVYIPDDPRFGIHQKDFANTLALYEERPAKDWSNADFFGNSPDIESTRKVLEELAEDNDNSVDQRFALKSRLFDLVIGDWDRHDDQWRWAELEKDGKGKLYQPIPRDRDQAFFISDGIFPALWTRKWAQPKFEGFDYEVDWPSGLMFNARHFDRSFLTGLEWETWQEVVKEIQRDLTDEEIEAAIKKWPDAIYSLTGEEVIAKIKSRRDKLQGYARDHYEFLARAVDVVGSDKHEHFQVDRLENGNVKVKVRKMKKDGDKKKTIYEREFVHGETKEIRLFGLDGEDEFEVEGETGKSIKVRIIGGPDEDEIDDDSKVGGLGRKTIVYDTKTGNELKLNNESRNRLSSDPRVNEYNRKEFRYNVLMPLVTANLNVDDGLFLGGGFVYTNHGFRKEPFKSQHKVLASYAFNTSSYNFAYNGTYTDVLGKWDLRTDVNLRVPDFTNNFFGVGNESVFDQNINETVAVDNAINYYRLRFQEIKLNVGLFRELGAYGTFGIQANYFDWELEEFDDGPKFVEQYILDNNLDFEEQGVRYLGTSAIFEVDTRKNKVLPAQGIHWTNSLNTFFNIDGATDDFHQFETNLSLYHSFRLPARLTFAARVGYGSNIGDNYPFFVAQTLGGFSQLRGFRRTRFYGDQRFYNNFEMRLKLFNLRTYLFPAAIGILGFHDIGRVWLEGEDSSKWHRGFGGGLWFTPFNMTVLSAEIGHSEEETLFYFRFGFLF